MAVIAVFGVIAAVGLRVLLRSGCNSMAVVWWCAFRFGETAVVGGRGWMGAETQRFGGPHCWQC